MMILHAQPRKILGKKVNALRKEGLLPAVLFGAGIPSQPLTLNKIEFEKVFTEAGESRLIDLHIDQKETGKVLVSDVQYDPVSDAALHVDLQKVKMKEKVTATISIEIEGESPVVKSGEGMLLTLLDEVEVECLPTDLPPAIKVDVSNLAEVDQGIVVKDLPLDWDKVKVLGHEPDDLVLKIERPKMEEEVEEEAPVTPEEVEVTEEKPVEEEEEPSEEK